jgi:IMP cyclohydrolase
MQNEASRNYANLAQNPYPGRGIVVGLSDTGQHLVQVYWIMGRSENSRNRVFSSTGGRLFTQAADPSKIQDPKLIIYNAMDERDGSFVVSNGHQTDTVIQRAGDILENALREWEYEPDAPNYTPRITAVCGVRVSNRPFAEMSILRKSAFGKGCDRSYYFFDELGQGFGFCITTYSGDGSPLPAFRGEPYLIPLHGDPFQIARGFWEALNRENRISLAVKFIDLGSRASAIEIVNKCSPI